MANLLGRSSQPRRPADFDAALRDRIDARRALLARLRGAGRLAEADARLEALAPELEEFDAEPDLVTAAALLETIDGIREGFSAGLPGATAGSASHPGVDEAARRGSSSGADDAFVCHRPGRSLATGEAEVASRGYFDAVDRPPIVAWVGLLELARERRGQTAAKDFVIVAWVAPEDRERADAGVRACKSGALAWLDDLAPRAAAELAARRATSKRADRL